MKIKKMVYTLERMRKSLWESIKEAESKQQKEAFINLLYSDVEKVIFALNTLYANMTSKEYQELDFNKVMTK